MSTETPPAAAAALPETTPLTPPTPTPATPPAEERAPLAPEKTAKMAASLAALLSKNDDDPTLPKKPKEEKKAAPEVKPEPEKPRAKDEKPIKVRKAAPPAVVKPPVPSREEAKAPVTPVAPVAAPPAIEEDFEKSLFDEERALLQDARDAESMLGSKYKGHGTKMLAFLKESAAKEKQVEAGDLDEAEYREWYEENRPQITPLDFRSIERERVKADVKREFEPKLEEERHARWAETQAPKIETWGQELKRSLWNESIPAEVTAAAAERLEGVTDPKEREKIIGEVRRDYALEIETAERVVSDANEDIKEFYRLMTTNPATGRPLKTRNFDLSTPEGRQHQRLSAMASEICETFAKNAPVDQQQRDGKWFATWQQWANMTPEQRQGWWTFSNDELISHARAAVKDVVARTISHRTQELEARGFKRVLAAKAKPVDAPPAAPRQSSPPAPRVTPPPPDGSSGGSSMGARLAHALGSKPI